MEINQEELAKHREELVKRREELDLQLEELDKDKVKFSVDAGIIDRLGRELVGRQETAVAELVKNAYDADAAEVTLRFIETDTAGGTLIIEDDGHGMDLSSLRNGFMRLSSTDKVHNPVSPKFKRKRAGRKGIGRFATQRLGRKLTITTQTVNSDEALQLVINWDDYKIDRNLDLIANPVSVVPKEKLCGTRLTIEYLREKWTYSEIQRIFRYVSDLLQPSYLSDRTNKQVVIASQQSESFTVICTRQIGETAEKVSDIDKSFFSKALAIFEGHIDSSGDGFCSIESKILDIDPIQNLMSISAGPDESEEKYSILRDVHFKAYYFIYAEDYYESKGISFSGIELKRVRNFADEASGIRLYRNGFRVSPYGDRGDDWLEFDKRFTSSSGKNIVPLNNINLFGFVELIDEEGILSEETSSREGLIKNEAFFELVDFLKKAFKVCRRRFEATSEFKAKREKRKKRQQEKKEQREKLKKLKDFIQSSASTTSEDNQGTAADDEANRQEVADIVDELEEKLEEQIGEIAMLRILAGIGLSIGEFVHEIRQFGPTFQSELDTLIMLAKDELIKKSVEGLQRNFEQFKTFAAYFDETIDQNKTRELKPIEIRDAVQGLLNVTRKSAEKNEIEIDTYYEGYDLFTCPMHLSELNSILFNLYSNAKKAILKKDVSGKILIVGKEENGKIVLEFSDNGIGIPEENKERIFTPFFTTSTPVGRGAFQNEELTGSGLGLKIVADIVEAYDGEIFVTHPPEGFKTCLHIELPKATNQQIDQQNDEYLFSS
jgi:signal transduction histidine kinase